jgi:predicted acetyltransferase
MLTQDKSFCRSLGLTDVLITCDQDNLGSRRAIEANGGVLERVAGGQARYRLSTAPQST